MSIPEPPKRERVGWGRTRLPFEPIPVASAAQRGWVILYAIVAAVLAVTALYMGLVARLPLMSGYVLAPAIGAAWFGLRVFMILTPKV